MNKIDRRGFTLIELMVVLAIIVVLAGIIYASAGGAREKSRQTNCVSNLRQIGAAFSMYVQDYDIADDPVLMSHISGAWDEKLNPYLRGAKAVYRCLDDSEWNPATQTVSYNWHIYPEPPPLPLLPSFVQNFRLCGTSHPIATDIKHNFPNPNLPRSSSLYSLILHMDGSVSAKNIRMGVSPCEY